MPTDTLAPITLCTRCGHTFSPNLHVSNASQSKTIEHLRDYSVLLNTEIRQISEGLGRYDDEIARFNLEIDRLRLTLSTLETQRDGLVRERDIQRSRASPFRRLPVELLEDIFALCAHFPERDEEEQLFAHRRGNKPVSITVSLPILPISQTCSLWKKVCHSRPEFWTDIRVHFDSMYDIAYSDELYSAKAGSLIALLESYLSRSKSFPLTIDFQAFGPLVIPENSMNESNCNGFQLAIQNVLDPLLGEADRWKQVVLALDSTLFRHLAELYFPPSGKPRFIALDALFVIEDEFDDDLEDGYSCHGEVCQHLFSEAPIRQLFLSSYDPWKSYKPSHTLTTLTFDTLSNESLSILEHCPNLESLRLLRYADDIGEQSTDEKTFLCPQLTHLDICMDVITSTHFGFPNIPSLFSMFAFPSLASLVVSAKLPVSPLDSYQRARWIHDDFTDMRGQSSFSLRTLSLVDIDISFGELADVLDETPDLTHLTLRSPARGERQPIPSLLHYLNLDSVLYPGTKVPKLTNLELDLPNQIVNITKSDVIKDACEMLESRIAASGYQIEPCQSLRRFKLDLPSSIKPGDVDWMPRFNALASGSGRQYFIT